MQIINISNSPEGYKRKVEVYAWGANYEAKIVFIDTRCRHYVDDNGDYGALVEKQSVVTFTRRLEANMNRFVDPADGMDAIRETVEGQEVFKRADNNQSIASPIRQYDFFVGLITSQPISVPTLIAQFVTVEDLVHQSYNK